MSTTVRAWVNSAQFGYPPRPLFETGGRKGFYAVGSTVESLDRTYRTPAAAKGVVTRLLNAWADGRVFVEDVTGPDGIRRVVYRGTQTWRGDYAYVMISVRVVTTDD